MDDQLSDLVQPITLNWRVSELKRWFEDFRDDSDRSIVIFHSPAKGYINIYQDPFTSVGIHCDPQSNGQILLTPYIHDDAQPAAVAELRRWRHALTSAGVTPAEVDPTALGIRAKRLGIRSDRLLRWDAISTKHYPKGLTQAAIAEIEQVSPETIKADFKDMRKRGLLPSNNSTV